MIRDSFDGGVVEEILEIPPNLKSMLDEYRDVFEGKTPARQQGPRLGMASCPWISAP